MSQEKLRRRGVSRRSFLSMVALSTGASVLAACGAAVQPGGQSVATESESSNTAPTEAARPAQASGPAELRWEFRGDEVEFQRATANIEKFMEKNPNIKVKIERAPDEQRDEKLVTAMIGGTAPDIFEAWGDIVYKFADKDQILDLNPYVSDLSADDLKDFYKWQWDGFAEFNNIRFGMPKYVNIMGLWYNKDMFDAAKVPYPDKSWNHDDYANAMKQLTIDKDNDGLPEVWGGWIPAWSWDRFWYRLPMWGGDVRDANDPSKCTLDDPKSQEALEWTRKLMWDDKVLAQPLALGAKNWSDAVFYPQKAAMCEDGTYPQAVARNVAGNFKWGYQHIPAGPAGIRKSLGTTDGFCVWKNTKHPDAAWELVKFLSGPVYQEDQVKATGLLPVRFSVLEKWEQINIDQAPELADVNLHWAVEALQEGYPSSRRVFKNQNAAAEIINPALEKVYSIGDTPVSYLADIAAEVNKSQQ
jgi:multiple sugar transport system substrate-binding protein